jgi:NAD(P)H-dependent FMN reductase
MITILSGTNRPGSNTRKIAGVIEHLYRDLKVPSRVLDLHDLPAELFLPSAYANKPASFQPFSQAVLDSNGIVIVTPEYNGSMPGVLKLFIDHLKFPESFEGRPVCFVGLAAGMWGALRSVEQLQSIFGYRNAHIYPKRVFMPGIGQSLDASGQFSNAELTARLKEQAEGFTTFVEQIQGRKLRAA